MPVTIRGQLWSSASLHSRPALVRCQSPFAASSGLVPVSIRGQLWSSASLHSRPALVECQSPFAASSGPVPVTIRGQLWSSASLHSRPVLVQCQSPFTKISPVINFAASLLPSVKRKRVSAVISRRLFDGKPSFFLKYLQSYQFSSNSAFL